MKRQTVGYTVYKIDCNLMSGVQHTDESYFTVKGADDTELEKKAGEKLHEIREKWERKGGYFYIDDVKYYEPMEEEEE